MKARFAKKALGGEIDSAKESSSDVVTYPLVYRLSNKEHQITLTEEGVRTPKKKERGEKK